MLSDASDEILSIAAVIAFTGILFRISSRIIGTVNFNLNDKHSLRRHINLSDKVSWLLPKYGWYHHSYGRRGYKIYLYTAIFGFINDALLLILSLLSIMLEYLTTFNIFYLFTVPIIYLVVVLISGFIVIKNCKPDPNPFH